jgi:predicted Zn-dependent peptidase
VRLYRTWTLPGMADPDAVPLDIGGTVLGGLSSSRLDNILVRQEKLAVGVSAGTYSFAQMGMFEITVNVRPGVDPDKVSARLDQIVADFVKTGPTADEVNRAVTREISGRIAGLESVGGFGGKAVALAEGALYMKDSEFYKKNLKAFASATPATVTTAMQKWLSRPVYALKVVPGEREAYDESAAGKAGARTHAPSYYRIPKVGEQPLAPAARATAEPAKPAMGIDRSKMPEVGDIADLDFPKVERAKLKNGMTLVYSRRTAVPRTQIALSFDAGFVADPKGKLGTQSLMLALMDEGTTTLNSTQLAEAQERLGASISTGASLDRTSVSLSTLSANLKPALALFSDVVLNPAFDAGEVERLRNQQLARISAELTQPEGLAGRALPPILFGPNHPYAIPGNGTGDPATVKSLTRDELIAFHKAWLRPDKGTFFVVSDKPLAAIRKELDARFGGWKGEGAAGIKANGIGPVAPKPRIVLINRPDSPQSLIVGGIPLPLKGRDEVITLLTANEVLGSGFLSRLNMDLRETKGWSYGVSGSLRRPEGDMSYVVGAPVQANKTGDSITALRHQMKLILGDKPITQEERDRTINGSIRELPGSFETSGAVLGAMMRNDQLARSDDYYDTMASRYRAMTIKDLQEALKTVAKPDEFVWVVVGDAKIVRPQVEKLGLPVEDMPISLPTSDSVRGE